MDWAKLIGELLGIGLTQQQIADACATHQSGVSDLANGKRKKVEFELGSALVTYHAKQMAYHRRAQRPPTKSAPAPQARRMPDV